MFAAGTCAVVYGGFYHRLPITEVHEEEVSVPVPVEPQMFPPSPFGPPQDFKPPVKYVKQIKTSKTTTNESELAVNRAMTIGGLSRTADGELLRAAVAALGGGEKGPALCPT
jgi:hypothetical protein